MPLRAYLPWAVVRMRIIYSLFVNVPVLSNLKMDLVTIWSGGAWELYIIFCTSETVAFQKKGIFLRGRIVSGYLTSKELKLYQGLGANDAPNCCYKGTFPLQHSISNGIFKKHKNYESDKKNHQHEWETNQRN